MLRYDKQRFEETSLDEVIQELYRDDLDGGHIVAQLPDECDVEIIISDKCEVRYFIYTTDKIFEVFINVFIASGKIDGVFKDVIEEDWEIILIPR